MEMEIWIWTENNAQKDNFRYMAECKYKGDSIFKADDYHISLLMEKVKNFTADFFKYGLQFAQNNN
jgi:PhoPQ-activated pathogenicity-related protein